MEWSRGPIIGRGSTATVSLATALPSGELFAVKSAELARSGFLQKEHKFLSQLTSPNVVTHIGSDINVEDNKLTYNLFIEYLPKGTLRDEIARQGGRIPEPSIGLLARQVLTGLSCLHGNGIVHCDIKSQNILMGRHGAKIADLGCARYVNDPIFSVSGTPVFLSPEAARGEAQGFEADVWAVGCTIIEMATGGLPWPEVTDPVSALYTIGFSGDVPEPPVGFSEEGVDFLSKCFKRDPRERWTVEELLGHPFLDQVIKDDGFSCFSSFSSPVMISGEPFEGRMEKLTVAGKNPFLDQVKDDGCLCDSPRCVLDRGFWEASGGFSGPVMITGESFEGRIEKLVSGGEAEWGYDDEDWVTVRSSEGEESDEDCLDEAVMGSWAMDGEEDGVISVFGNDLFMSYCFETLSRISSIGRGVVKDDVVYRNSDYQINEKFWFLQSCFLLFRFNYLTSVGNKVST